MDYSIKQRVDIRHNCPPFGVFLRWINPLNGFDAWLFSGRTTRVLDVGDAVTFQSYDERTEEILKKDAAPVITLRTANFSRAQAIGLSTLFTSPIVKAYIGSDGNPVSVRIGNGSFTTIDELEKRQTLSFDIYLPKINSLAQ